MMNPVIIHECDQWKSYSSFKLVGVFTNRRSMLKTIRKLFKKDRIDLDFPISKLKYKTISQMRTIDYLHIEEIELNENLL